MGGFAATGNPVPKGASQLPRPAIIRLSGATISVNVLDFELRSEPGPTSVVRALVPVPSLTPRPSPSRNIIRCTLTHQPNVYLAIYNPFDPVLSRLPLGSRHDFQAVSRICLHTNAHGSLCCHIICWPNVLHDKSSG